MALTQRNHDIICEYFADKNRSNMIAIDATCGNGHDTLFLAQLAFKKVYGFDIQQQAIDNTQQLVDQQNLNTVNLIKTGHEKISQHVTENVDCIMFNLGYLPSADKNITTTEKTSLSALEQSLGLLNSGGLLSILCYPGHPQGLKETKAIQQWFGSLNNSIEVTETLASHPSLKAPVLYIIKKQP